MRTLIRMVILVIVFVGTCSIAEEIAGIFPGTPTKQLNSLLADSSGNACQLADKLDSPGGRAVLAGHSRWIVLIFLPLASGAVALTGRLLKYPLAFCLGVIVFLVAAQMLLMVAASPALPQLTGLLGNPVSGVGATRADFGIGLALSIVVSGVILSIGRSHGVSRTTTTA